MINTFIIALIHPVMLAYNFRQPLDVPTTAISMLWALPICLSIAIIYKAVRLETVQFGPMVRSVALLFLTIVGFMILVAAGLLGIAWLAKI